MRTQILATLVLCGALAAHGQSLWNNSGNGGRSMYADRTAAAIGDILLVMVTEANTVTRSASRSTASNTNINYGINSYLFPGSSFGTHNGERPSISLAPQDSFSGEGSFSDSNTLTTRAAVLVVDVLPNGNLVIEGARKIEMQGEVQYVVLRGIVRGDDVRSDNSVMSYNIVNANIEFLGEGDIVNAQRKGWIQRLLDTVNIF